MLLILHPYKFTLFHKKRIELELLKKQLNQKIEIHDLGGILNKKWGEAFLTKEEKKVKKFYSIFRWIKYFKNLNKKNLVIISFISPNSVKSIIIHYFLLSAKVKIIKIYSSGVYHSDLSYKSFVNLKSITKKLKSVFYDYKKLIFYINMKFYEQIFKFFKFKKNIILFTGTQKINPFPNQSDKYYNFHSYDYSEYLRKKNQCNISKKYIIFLDSSGPHFTYDENLFGFKEFKYIDKKKWYFELNEFFSKLEVILKSKVLIIPHSKNKGAINPYYDKKFKVIHDLDGALKYSMKSKFIIAHSVSTALNYGIANNRNIILFYNNIMKHKMLKRFEDINILSKILDTPLININKNFTRKNLLKKINKKKYYSYIHKYVTSKKISKKMNFEILEQIVNN